MIVLEFYEEKKGWRNVIMMLLLFFFIFFKRCECGFIMLPAASIVYHDAIDFRPSELMSRLCLCYSDLLLSQSVDCGSYKLYLCVCMCVSLCVCVWSAFTAYILLTSMGQILIKLGENVRTLVRLIVSKFHKNRFSFDVIMMSFLFFVSYF